MSAAGAGDGRVQPTPPTALIVMGVSGSGKSTISALLAARLGWQFEDGDWFHPAANVDKMHRGLPLDDDDRWPWMRAIVGLMPHSEAMLFHRSTN